jgi:16S rRNA processing protein RimM
VVKPHGKRGEVVTDPVHGLPPLLHKGLTVAVVPPLLKEDRWHTVLGASNDGASGQLVALSGVSDIAAAEAICGCTLLARVEDLPEGYALHDVDALLGREVTDQTFGPIGSIVEVLRSVANDVWVIDGPYGEVLLPAVDEVVLQLPPAGPIEVLAPVGLVPVEGDGHAL